MISLSKRPSEDLDLCLTAGLSDMDMYISSLNVSFIELGLLISLGFEVSVFTAAK